MPSNRAYVEQSSISKVPVLTTGSITPDVLANWWHRTLTYFEEKNIADVDQVRKVQWGLQDASIQTWIAIDSIRFCSLSFAAFMLEFQKSWLEPDWQNKLISRILTLHQSENAFWDWSNCLHALNAQLFGTMDWLTDSAFCRQLSATMNIELHAEVISGDLSTTSSLSDWLMAVKHLDDARLCQIKRIRAKHTRYRASTTISKPARSAPSGSSSSCSFPSASTPMTYLAKLTEAKWKELSANDGCFKCRRLHADHLASACPNSFPDASMYRGLISIPAIAKPAPQGRIAAIVPIMEAPLSGVLLDNDSDEEIPCVSHLAPFQMPSLVWHCLIDGPTLDQTISTQALIDDGSQFVLIRDSLIKATGLRRRPLPEPIPLGLAMGGGENSAIILVPSVPACIKSASMPVSIDFASEATPASLVSSVPMRTDAPPMFFASEWVKLLLLSPNRAFSSHTVRALIAPDSLCLLIILGGALPVPQLRGPRPQAWLMHLKVLKLQPLAQ